MKHSSFAVLSLVFLLACSDDEEEKKPGKTNDDNAKQNGKQQTTAIYSAMESGGTSAVDGLYAAGSSSQGTVTAQSFVPSLGQELNIETLHPLADPPGCTCNAGSCTFTNCERESGGKVKLNGTLSAANGTFKADLTWEVDGSGGAAASGIGSQTKIHITADLAVTATSIKGTYHTDGSVKISGLNLPNVPGVAAAGAGNVEWTNDATWDVAVTNKAPTGGTITYSGTYKTGQGTYTGGSTVKYP